MQTIDFLLGLMSGVAATVGLRRLRYARPAKLSQNFGSLRDLALATPVAARLETVGDGERVRLVGTVALDNTTLNAPATDRPCVAYVAFSPTLSVTVARKVTAFVLDVGGRRVRVEPEADAHLLVLSERVEIKTPASARVVSERLGVPLNAPVWEAVFSPGERVSVVGCARWEPDPTGSDAAYRTSAQGPLRLVLGPQEGKKVLLSDHPDIVNAGAGS